MKITKKIILVLIATIVAAAMAWSYFSPKAPTYKTEKAVRGDIVQEISETGAVKKGNEIKLNFKNPGTVLKLTIRTGDKIAAGQVLAELDSGQVAIQLEQARASLKLYNAQLEKLLNGATEQDLNLAWVALKNSDSNLESARQSLADAQASAVQKAASAYKSAGDTLNSAYAKAYNAQNLVGLVQRTYFAPRDPDSIYVWEALQRITVSVEAIKKSLDRYGIALADKDRDDSLADVETELSAIDGNIQDVRDICEKMPWRDSVATTDKSNLDLQRDYVVAAQTAVNSARQNILLTRTANDTAVNAAKAAVTAAQGSRAAYQEQLDKIAAAPRKEDIDSVRAQIEQAQAQVNLLQLQISDSQLKSPVSGQVAQINTRIGESSSLAMAMGAIVIIPEDPFEVELDLYEEDVAKAKVGDPVVITIVALPEQIYNGNVLSIDPAGKLVNGVVYYATRIGFDEIPAGIRADMSADVVITTASKKNVIIVSESAIQKKGKDLFVQILKDGNPVESRVMVGIRSKGQAEIFSGVNEGDEVVIP